MHEKTLLLLFITCSLCVSQMTFPLKRVQNLVVEPVEILNSSTNNISEKILETFSMDGFHRSDIRKPLTNYFNVKNDTEISFNLTSRFNIILIFLLEHQVKISQSY